MGADPERRRPLCFGKGSKAGARQILGIVGFVVLLRAEAPGAEIDGVKGDAEEIGGDEAELRGAGADDAHNGAVDGANHPALPELLAKQNGAENGQNAGDVIQPNSLE